MNDVQSSGERANNNDSASVAQQVASKCEFAETRVVADCIRHHFASHRPHSRLRQVEVAIGEELRAELKEPLFLYRQHWDIQVVTLGSIDAPQLQLRQAFDRRAEWRLQDETWCTGELHTCSARSELGGRGEGTLGGCARARGSLSQSSLCVASLVKQSLGTQRSGFRQVSGGELLRVQQGSGSVHRSERS